MKNMTYKKVIRRVVKILLLDHIFEFIYWLVAIGLMIYLIGLLVPYSILAYLAIAGYVAAVVALYFMVVKRLKSFFYKSG